MGPRVYANNVYIHLYAIGGQECGKTNLFHRFLTENYLGQETYILGIEDRLITTRQPFNSHGINSVKILMTDCSSVGDTENFHGVRTWPYVHIVLSCFDLCNQESFQWAQDYSMDVYKEYGKGLPIVLVGCKKDQRDAFLDVPIYVADGGSPIRTSFGKSAVESLGAVMYAECSAKTGEGIEELVMDCCEVAARWNWPSELKVPPNRESRLCIIT